VEETSSFFILQNAKNSTFKAKLGSLSSFISQEMNEIQVASYALKDLKEPWIEAKHWKLIFREVGAHQRFSNEFTLKDILDAGIYSHQESVQVIYRTSKT